MFLSCFCVLKISLLPQKAAKSGQKSESWGKYEMQNLSCNVVNNRYVEDEKNKQPLFATNPL